MATAYRHPRGTRAAFETLAAAEQLQPGQIYLLTDEDRIVCATGVSTYAEYALLDEAIAAKDRSQHFGTQPLSSISDAGVAAAANSLAEIPGAGAAFTPALTAQTTPPTGVAYGAQAGYWRRLGADLIWFQLRILLSSVGTGGAGDIFVTGLPAANAVAVVAPLATTLHNVNLSAGYTAATASVEASSANIRIREWGDAVAQQPLNWSALAGDSIVTLSGIYQGSL